jgi:cytochrome c oxidase subunit 4
MAHHPTVSPRTYAAVYVVLISLTFLTALIAIKAHLGLWEIPVALGIAAAKTVLVGLFFMHLIGSPRLTYLIVGAGVVFLAIMLGLTWVDYYSRPMIPAQGLPRAVSPED